MGTNETLSKALACPGSQQVGIRSQNWSLDSNRILIRSPLEPHPDVFIRVTLATQALRYPDTMSVSTYVPLCVSSHVGSTWSPWPLPSGPMGRVSCNQDTKLLQPTQELGLATEESFPSTVPRVCGLLMPQLFSHGAPFPRGTNGAWVCGDAGAPPRSSSPSRPASPVRTTARVGCGS